MAQPGDIQEIEVIKSVVGKYFPIYDVKVSFDSMTLYVSPVLETLDSDFEKMRKELGVKKYIPVLNRTAGEYVIQIVKRPELRTRSIWVNWIMLIATIASTVFAGAFLWSDYQQVELFDPGTFAWGALFFAFPLLAILGVHELAHYLMSKRHGVDASLPFFIPSVPPLGTFGAFISMRDPMPNRKALLDIGVAGPLAGLVVTIPVTIIGLYLTAQGDVQIGGVGELGAIGLSVPPLFEVFTYLIHVPDNVALHPTGFAAWVGFLVTAINLLPSGQLDGGHIARALLGDNARYLSYITIGALFLMGLIFPGWLFFAIIILFLGLRHPPPLNDISKIGPKRQVVGAIALVILLTSFVPVPMFTITPNYQVDISVQGANNTTAYPGDSVYFYMGVNNTGNTNVNVTMSVVQVPSGWGAVVYLSNGSAENATNALNFNLPYKGNTNVTLRIDVAIDATPSNRTLILESQTKDTSKQEFFTIEVLV
ncbi:MAG: site-2 protease family protein [Methanomassiliicoccales archaeon]|nr:site-2 protease family protein [Methanomassiliicoccales archaeon]NYT16096.1 site-2 protease family protein [Methanomassiliicoccales archaeon]